MINKFFLRRFLLFFVVMMAPCLLFGAIYFGYMNNSIRTQNEKDARNSLSSIRDNVDLVLGSAAYQQQLLTANPRMTLAMQKLFNRQYMTYEDTNIFNSINAIFASAVNTKLYIINIYFYLDGCDRFLSTSDGIVSMESFSDKQWLDVYRDTNNGSDTWVAKRSFLQSSLHPEKEVITVFQKIRNANGVIAININPERFEAILDSAQIQNGQLLFILDDKDNILFSNESGSEMRRDEGQHLFRQDGDIPVVTLDGESYMYHYEELSGYRVRLVSLVNEKTC